MTTTKTATSTHRQKPQGQCSTAALGCVQHQHPAQRSAATPGCVLFCTLWCVFFSGLSLSTAHAMFVPRTERCYTPSQKSAPNPTSRFNMDTSRTRTELTQEPDNKAHSTDMGEDAGDQDRTVEPILIHIRKRTPGRRLDKVLRDRFPRISRTMIQKMIKEGDVTVNDLPSKPSYEPAKDDVITLMTPPPPPSRVIPEDIPIDVLYEDDHMLAINKSTGIICHPSGATQTGTLVHALAHHAEKLSAGSDPFRPGIVHRLDKNTSGVMLVAKTDEAHWRLAQQFERRTLQKTYLAIAEGEISLDADVINAPLATNPYIKDRFMVAGKPVHSQIVKEAITFYTVAERFTGFTLVELSPKTGRTHQLRVHMSSIGHPLLGDTHYGGHLVTEDDITGNGSTDPLLSYQALHAWRIEFVHPIFERKMTIEAPIRDRIQWITQLLRDHRSKQSGGRSVRHSGGHSGKRST